MAATAQQPGDVAAVPRPSGPLVIAGVASLGAGAVHAVAVGTHAEHPAAARAFVVLALVQLGWGAVALTARNRGWAVVGLAVHGLALAGWVATKTRGISLVDGLGDVEAIQWADALAAASAAVALVVSLRVLVAGGRSRSPGRPVLVGTTAVLGVVALLAMTSAGTHRHAGDDHAHDGAEAAAGEVEGDGTHGHGASAASSGAVPYDPALPVDLGGVPGVTAQQQADAEALVTDTLARLPQFADYEESVAEGYSSIRDAATGHEHLIKWANLQDGRELDPDAPEALVFEVGPQGERTLVSAMFMLATGTRLDDAPDLGGALTQWHVHEDLCLSADPVAPRVVGLTSIDGECRPPTRKMEPVPMIHVWITKHPCGPFAALEGIGAGQVADGEVPACDHAHGA